MALDVDVTLEHVQDPESAVKVQVFYPDGQAQMIHPKPADLRNPGPPRAPPAYHSGVPLPYCLDRTMPGGSEAATGLQLQFPHSKIPLD